MAKPWRVLLITSVGLFMSSLDLFIVNIAFPDIAIDFPGTSLADLSWILNGYAIVFAALLVPAGRFADRVGRKRVFIHGLLVFAAASAACALAPSVGALVGARLLQAIGGALMIPATLGLILPAFPEHQRPLAVGIWSAAGGVAAALGPPIGGLLVQASWRWIFIVNVPIAIVTALVARAVLSELREPDEARPDLLGSALLAAGLGLLTLGIVKSPDWGLGDMRAVSALTGSLCLVAAFLWRSARHRVPVIELPLLRIRSFALANLAAAVFFAGFGAMLLSSILLLTEVWGYSALTAGLALTPAPTVAALFAVPSGRLGGQIGQRPIAAVGGLTFALGFVYLLLTIGTTPDYLAAFLPGALCAGSGFGMVVGTLPAVATAALPESRFATGTAIFSMARQLGTAIGVAILVAVVDSATAADLLPGIRRGWTFALLAGLATTALALAIGPATERGERGVALAVPVNPSP
jgi:EmrB/QacA subfamily drug resistance transporter